MDPTPAAATSKQAQTNQSNNKTEVSATTATADEQLKQKYGKLPTKRDIVAHKLKERKYFDSGDYAMYKATGKQPVNGGVGSIIPSPDMIPHSHGASSAGGSGTSGPKHSSTTSTTATSAAAAEHEGK